MPRLRARAAVVALLTALATAAGAEPGPALARSDARPPCAHRTAERQPFFGDTHVHTAFSQDASTQGTRTLPREAYAFARGEPLGIQPFGPDGRPLRTLRLGRPLDFAIVTDHAEQLGETRVCATPGLPGHDSLICRIHRRWPRFSFYLMNMKATWFDPPSRFGFCGPGGRDCLDAARTPWRTIQQAAEEAYDRSDACQFTSFVGYEWTGASRSRNLHRNVIFRNEVVPELPASFFEAPSIEALWAALRRDCVDAGTGCDVLTIPHNANLSGGLMFERPPGADRAWASERARMEPLVEVMQHKGDSECQLTPTNEDELCDFEKLPYDDFQGKYVPWLAEAPDARSTVRYALGEGLRAERELGVNPFRFGLLASTDTHLGASGYVDETNHPGHGGAGAPAAIRMPEGLPDDLELGPGGLAVLYAEENSREALFAAMQRREAYGTSGPRLGVRLFAGFELPVDLCERADFAAAGYAHGVPMGGVLPAAGTEAPAPRFAVHARRDPGDPGRPGAPLQRIQLVKGWLENGAVRERVYEVAGDPANGADVDLASCTPRGAGADSLCRVFEDPDFTPDVPAFWYVRVLENPTCRWSAHLCVRRGVDCARPETIGPGLAPCCATDHHWTLQERAWTSPIWYSPAPGAP